MGRPFQYHLLCHFWGCGHPGYLCEIRYHPAGSNLSGLRRLPYHRLHWNSFCSPVPGELSTGLWTWWGYILTGSTVAHESMWRNRWTPLYSGISKISPYCPSPRDRRGSTYDLPIEVPWISSSPTAVVWLCCFELDLSLGESCLCFFPTLFKSTFFGDGLSTQTGVVVRNYPLSILFCRDLYYARDPESTSSTSRVL